jgi:hypothetical protein
MGRAREIFLNGDWIMGEQRLRLGVSMWLVMAEDGFAVQTEKSVQDVSPQTVILYLSSPYFVMANISGFC